MKGKKWSYRKSVRRAKAALARWNRATMEAAQILYEEKKALAEQEGQDRDCEAEDYVPTWKAFSFDILLPTFFDRVLSGWNGLSEFLAGEKTKKTKRSAP